MVTDRPKSFFQHCVSTSMAETISILYYDTLTCWLIVFRLCHSMKTNNLIITVVLPKLLQLSVMNFLTFEMVTLKIGTRSVTTISCHPQCPCTGSINRYNQLSRVTYCNEMCCIDTLTQTDSDALAFICIKYYMYTFINYSTIICTALPV